jgi:hypothetical protein
MKIKMRKIKPALTLMIASPLLTEVLPGSTRFSTIFVFPIEICVWGGGALLIRYAIRRKHLGWLNMLLLALALSVAEEFLIQQTSVAPMVVQLKNIIYARAFGINYVYLLWALAYETIFVVFLPIYLVELIFPYRREELWINRAGIVLIMLLFVLGSFFAWYSWTQIARPKVFHVPTYNPPLGTIVIAVILIFGLLFAALGPIREKFEIKLLPLKTPRLRTLNVASALWAVLWYGLVILAVGIAPSFPPVLAVGAGLLMVAAILFLVPRWTIDKGWNHNHTFALIFGATLGSMIAGFLGFIGTTAIDLYFKIIVDVLACVLLIVFGYNIAKQVKSENMLSVDVTKEI